MSRWVRGNYNHHKKYLYGRLGTDDGSNHTTPTKCEHPHRTPQGSCATAQDPHDRLEQKINGGRTPEIPPAGRMKASLSFLPTRGQDDGGTSDFRLRCESTRTDGRRGGRNERTDERTDGLGLGHAGVRVLGQLDGRKADKDEQEATASELLDDCDE
ncbi:hypothetical protein F443_14656 [Phytophthora nicotianae P1569]|uniref:Uncharacterized protein n=1 Tax=Phytophthora nicotianae P1569 TaxID=1317065 RepID=V9EKN3_PHYNI|nr:hypothetical protein F443_14656 [Phytophthora nicotianae P1569]